MKKKLFVALLLLVVITAFYFNYERLLNIFNSSNSRNTEDVDINKLHIINQRYYSLLASLNFSGMLFPSKKIYDLNNNQLIPVPLKGMNIVIILSNAGCNPCQIRELKNIDSLYQKKKQILNVTVIYDGSDKEEELYLKKLSQVQFKFYYTKGYTFNEFNFTKRYPIVFFIRDNIILSSLIAIPDDDIFSSYFYKTVIKKITP